MSIIEVDIDIDSIFRQYFYVKSDNARICRCEPSVVEPITPANALPGNFEEIDATCGGLLTASKRRAFDDYFLNEAILTV